MVSTPSETPLAKSSTRAMVAPAKVAEAVAVTVLVVLTATAEPLAGAVTETVGALPPETVTVFVAEVVVPPTLSMATAVRA